MKIKVATWNIGAAKVSSQNSNGQYTEDGLNDIAEVLREESPDIICLQEVQSNADVNQAKQLASLCKYQFIAHHEFSNSHIDDGYMIGNAILSRIPIMNTIFGKFKNPDLTGLWNDKTKISSHDKGWIYVEIEKDHKRFSVTTTHLLPYKLFGLTPTSNNLPIYLNQISEQLVPKQHTAIVAGDFNLDTEDVLQLLPALYSAGFTEFSKGHLTTPNGRMYDRLFTRNVNAKEYKVLNSVKTDHYPVFMIIEIAPRS